MRIQSQIPHNSTSIFQIIVPVFNEEETLDQVLLHAQEHEYLKHMILVDDASTDSSPQILQEWARHRGIQAISLRNNRKKEGAIRAALEILEQEHRLAPYIVLLDSDSLIARSANGEAICDQIERAIVHMHTRGVYGMAFQINALANKTGNIFSYAAFAEYSAMQFDLWLVSKQQQLWVINGPGGIFESERLLEILRSIVPDFETGDLLITVELMKSKQPIEFYPDVSVMTFVPTTLKAYFSQRRRWERGTTKVLWNERQFYFCLYGGLSLLGIATLIHLLLYIGLMISVVMILSNAMTTGDAASVLVVSAVLWFVISVLKGAWLTLRRPHFPFVRYCLCAVGNGVLWAFITAPARITGFAEACIQLVSVTNRSEVPKRASIEESSWLTKDQIVLR